MVLSPHKINMKYSRFFYLFICFLALTQCQDKTKYSLSRVQMANILCDLHIAEGATSLLEGAKKDSVITLYYKQIFEIQGVNEAEFKENLDLLKTDAPEMAKVYKIVNDSLEKRKNRL
jgi:Domain of unknown function (DUF4296)